MIRIFFLKKKKHFFAFLSRIKIYTRTISITSHILYTTAGWNRNMKNENQSDFESFSVSFYHFCSALEIYNSFPLCDPRFFFGSFFKKSPCHRHIILSPLSKHLLQTSRVALKWKICFFLHPKIFFALLLFIHNNKILREDYHGKTDGNVNTHKQFSRR